MHMHMPDIPTAKSSRTCIAMIIGENIGCYNVPHIPIENAV